MNRADCIVSPTEVVDLMLDFYGRVLTAPSPDQDVQADDRAHVLELLKGCRSTYTGETEKNLRRSLELDHNNPA